MRLSLLAVAVALSGLSLTACDSGAAPESEAKVAPVAPAPKTRDQMLEESARQQIEAQMRAQGIEPAKE